MSTREAQQLTGRLSWVAGILPCARWAVTNPGSLRTPKGPRKDEIRRTKVLHTMVFHSNLL